VLVIVFGVYEMIKRFVPDVIKNLAKRSLDFCQWDQWAARSWSQEGEDLILRRIFEGRHDGFYIDVGAHHPKRFSNTFFFYRLGWRGINIDAMPGSMKLFRSVRPRDINLELGVGLNETELNYYVFNVPALNSFSKDLSLERHNVNSAYHILNVIKVSVRPLSKILADNLPDDQVIDFISVDVEGMDLDVLKSNNWQKYRPKIVLAEILCGSLHEIEESDIARYMASVGYVIYAKCANTTIFKSAK
jgi:FkbM family methyltransferase